jgi:hypothetical protein
MNSLKDQITEMEKAAIVKALKECAGLWQRQPENLALRKE